MSRPAVIQTVERPRGHVDFILSAGKEGRERVRVVRSPSGRYACMTCLTADSCVHADVSAQHYANLGAQSAA